VLVIGTRNEASDPNDPKRTGLDNPKYWTTIDTYAISGNPTGTDEISIIFTTTMIMSDYKNQFPGSTTAIIDEAGLYAYDDGDFTGIDIKNTPVTGFLNLSPSPTLFAYSVISPAIQWDADASNEVTFTWKIISD
jgi:hypothetical protein